MATLCQSGVSDKGAGFAYNPLGQFTTVATFASTTTSDPIAGSSYGYDDANRLTSLTQTKSSDSSTIAAYGFTYDANGQLTAETNPDGSIAYTYDHDGRLTGASGTGLPAAQDYAYDSNNNRTSTTVGSTTNTSIATGGNNQLATDGTYDYAYDADGNLITKTTIATGATENFAWDYRNRLTDITYKNSEGTTTQHIHYTYDVFNNRIGQEIDSTGSGTYDQVERYVYDPAGNLLMALNASGAVTHVFLNGPASNQVLADDAGSGNVTWMLADQQGSVRDVLDSTGASIDHIQYDPYGNILTQSSPTDQPRFLYAGMQLDTTGLYFDNARYYDPSTGSFISTDPTGFAGGSGNLYGYVNADPTNFVDPRGLSPKANGTGDDFGQDLRRGLAIAQGASVALLKGAAVVALLAVAPELAIPLLLDFAALDFANRIDQGFSGGNALLETGADISGVNGLSAGIYNQDILGSNLNLSDEARGEAFTGGLLQLGGLGYGLGKTPGGQYLTDQVASVLTDESGGFKLPGVNYGSPADPAVENTTLVGSLEEASAVDYEGRAAARDSAFETDNAANNLIERDPLDWSRPNWQGQTGYDHVMDHGLDNLNKEFQGVFTNDPVLTTEQAWTQAQLQGIQPTPQSNGNFKYVVPMGRPVGWQGGYNGTGAPLTNVRIVVNSINQVVTSFPE